MERERLAEEAHRQVIVAVAAVGRQRGSRIKRVEVQVIEEGHKTEKERAPRGGSEAPGAPT